MATNEPRPPRKRKVAEITPPDVGKSVEETSRTYYVLEEGRYVPVKKGSDVPPPAPAPEPDSDEDVDPVLEAEYDRQIQESDGFDLNVCIPNGSLFLINFMIIMRGSNFGLLRVEKYNVMFTGLTTYFITADVIDPSSNSSFVFQTCVTQTSWRNNEDFKIEAELCRLKPDTHGSKAEVEGCPWDSEAIHDFYKGGLNWLQDDALVQSSDKQHPHLYELQDTDIREYDWLNMYADYAFYTLWENGWKKLKFATPLEIKKVVVQTHEAMEPKEMLKAGNVVFYINFRDCGLTEEHRAVARRTTDGHPAHLCLEVKFPVGDLSTCSID
ncbi:PREDICTED: UPF0725 protein At4g29550-like [Camelina sativa]|uniref:UPF0725 protein At4g29550-like n=1 Tax=Camelina sativa TaxID=90675 RepID=A0ABM0URL6_CAMSA|nr:PREDICTED: UPF0725 protein At4g29550-like [Camelina sativa]